LAESFGRKERGSRRLRGQDNPSRPLTSEQFRRIAHQEDNRSGKATMSALHGSCFDASALIKRYLQEDGSDIIRTYWNQRTSKYTTSLCFYETLTLLKVAHFYRKTLDRPGYYRATEDLCSWFAEVVLKEYPEPNFLSPKVFYDAQKMVDQYQLDLSDAFQIMSVKAGFDAHSIGDSRPILVTADKNLAKAARIEGIRVWSVLEEPPPP
jgi:predicted nucleic acid-binding protein